MTAPPPDSETMAASVDPPSPVPVPASTTDESEDFLFSAFKKLKVDPQWSEDSLVNDVSTEALRDLWAGKSVKSRSRAKHRSRKSRHRRSGRLPYSVDNLPSMDKLSLSRESCSCTSCSQCRSENPFLLQAGSSKLDTKSILREARLKLHHSEKDRKNVIWKAKLNLRKTRSPYGASAAPAIPRSFLFGAKSKLPTASFTDVTSSSDPPPVTSKFESGPVFCERSEDERDDSLGEVKPKAKRSESKLHRTCSQEAKLDEMTVDELAGYLEDFVYLPKKMSEMAEMMYT